MQLLPSRKREGPGVGAEHKTAPCQAHPKPLPLAGGAHA